MDQHWVKHSQHHVIFLFGLLQKLNVAKNAQHCKCDAGSSKDKLEVSSKKTSTNTGARGRRRGRPCCRPPSQQPSIPPSRALDTRPSPRCRRLLRSWCRRWLMEPAGRLAPRCSHTLSRRPGCRSASPPPSIPAWPLPSVSACNLASQRRSNLGRADLCTLASALARTHLSLPCGNLAPRSQKPPCSPLRLGSPGKSFDLVGRTGTQGCSHKPGPPHCCTAALAHHCTLRSQQEHTPPGSPGKILEVPDEICPGVKLFQRSLLTGRQSSSGAP